MPEYQHLRVFLDSNVLFSASHKENSEFLDMWRMRYVQPVTSLYAVGEVSRHLGSLAQRERFSNLLKKTHLVQDAPVELIPHSVSMVEKDQPILAAALASRAEFLITGDVNHFGHLYNRTVAGVHILTPRSFLVLHKDRLIL